MWLITHHGGAERWHAFWPLLDRHWFQAILVDLTCVRICLHCGIKDRGFLRSKSSCSCLYIIVVYPHVRLSRRCVQSDSYTNLRMFKKRWMSVDRWNYIENGWAEMAFHWLLVNCYHVQYTIAQDMLLRTVCVTLRPPYFRSVIIMMMDRRCVSDLANQARNIWS